MSEEASDVVAPVKPSGGGGSKLTMLLLLVNLLGLGGLGGYLVLGKGHAAQAEEKKKDGHAEQPREIGPIIPLDPLVVNLGGPGEAADQARFLKVTVQLEAKNEPAKLEVEKAIVPIRSEMLTHFASLRIEETQGAASLTRLQAQLKRIANEQMRKRLVSRVYFTEFVVQ